MATVILYDVTMLRGLKIYGRGIFRVFVFEIGLRKFNKRTSEPDHSVIS